MQLYSFFNSSTSYRVRIALALKGLDYTYLPVNIRTGEHRDGQYVADVNPSASVPALVDGEFTLGQSLAIVDWLDARHPEPRLIPSDPELRARVLELSYLIACDIHPVNNLRVLRYLQDEITLSTQQKDAWYRHWVADGMAGVERLLVRAAREHGGPWCFGAQPTLADCCLVPQIANAQRMGCDLTPYARSLAVYRHADEHPAFVRAQPQRQPDYAA
ncbi:maleylacetoacetate isomerase [Paraburkholderia caballeronis]|uniref:Maleylacetoacetate isomerase n=1 Tax=Paraburkholderia caballeronis TaxID=416943 RepID=A0A1H7HPD2_9BURK|nr:maleylacetoacetate isomerase [Paraburkholderia caballeronis]PXW29463.1 maleylacetoacetate isomerase [Paraburkholderia caballeronis]PXX04722.1 maleylacetoacetate isomerase [Paraburkholderia caballeronis]RAK05783.1 maleylacetoacetate isomerase [Paraburkholderia caballeronis]TDV37193.1 maleylacetoacetate isomerase [Paraburkholderia caballeronis]SED03439.1 maleylacetoacetate isomerase [Paraburkholderia caballeronis]